MKAFKIKRGSESYYRVELLQQLCTDGKRRSVSARTRQEALDRARQELELFERGLDRNAGEKAVAEFLNEFLAFTRKTAASRLPRVRIIGTTSTHSLSKLWARSSCRTLIRGRWMRLRAL